MMFLLGRHAMFGHDPPMYLRSTAATRFPSPAKVHAATVEPVPPPRITKSNSSAFVMRLFLFDLSLNSPGQPLTPDCNQAATTRPPAARITSPVIQADSSDARNTASGAISVTRPSRPSGVFPARTAPAPPSKVPAAALPSVSV